MEPGSVILLVIVFFAAIYFGLLQLQSEEGLGTAKPTPTIQIHAVAAIQGQRNWTVTIIRRSGNVHDEWEIFGSANQAIESGISKLHQAGIYDVLIRVNGSKQLEVIAFYESQGSRRTGKYIGGFKITSG